MTSDARFEIFLTTAPGLEPILREELVEKGFRKPRCEPGGVAIRGDWADVWRANLVVRGAGRVLAALARFRVVHLSQLDKMAHQIPWETVLAPGTPFRVEASCRRSKLYHAGAVSERIGKAVATALRAPLDPAAEVCLRARIDDNVCVISIDTSGELLHRRGFKAEVNKAPMRETMAAQFLRSAGFNGKQALVDPMCGSGTFAIEAAEIAGGLVPGRARRFAFEALATFDAEAWQDIRVAAGRRAGEIPEAVTAFGSDRDPGAVRMSRANAERSGVRGRTRFDEADIADVLPPDTEPGLVIVNPPYGARIGKASGLTGLYASFGQRMRSHFPGWCVALITTDVKLVQATRLPFAETGPWVDHGGLKVRLHLTEPLG